MSSGPADKLRTSSSRDPDKNPICRYCRADMHGRNLILSIDGTSNQYGDKNTNVIELYARIIKDDTQLAYYNSGIGTYARPSWRSIHYWKQVFYNYLDLAIAWNFEKVVIAGYRWLSNHYQPGDKIFLFGFSRGAYQIRTLAAMVAKVGLILPGNEEQIPFAYELYADLRSHAQKGYDVEKSARFFKNTFCREDTKIHFVGAWDSVSSVGVVRDKSLPGTDIFNDNICYFRHALALDERRVKFLPEYICGGDSYEEQIAPGVEPRVKEVWFAGCHSDIGGGLRVNDKLDNSAVPVLWMGNEALRAGLRIKASTVEWKWEELETSRPTESLTWLWRAFELFPFKRLSYMDNAAATSWPHLFKGRVIKPGHKIHASVAFLQKYEPWAILPPGNKSWQDILEKGNKHEISWANGLRDVLELDLFDLSNINALLDGHDITSLGRLRFLSSTREGAESISKVDPNLESFERIFKKSDLAIAQYCAQVLLNLAQHDIVRRSLKWSKSVRTLAAAAVDNDSSVQLKADLLGILTLIFKDGKQRLEFKPVDDVDKSERRGALREASNPEVSTRSSDQFTGCLEAILTQLSVIGDPKKLQALCVLLDWNYILYLQSRAGLEGDVSTFEHCFRRSLQRASSHPSNSTYLEKAITAYRTRQSELATLPASVPGEYLVKFATCLQAHFFEAGRHRDDLDEAVKLLREALALCDGIETGELQVQRSSSRRKYITSIADTLTERFKQSNDSADIDEAIQLYRDVLAWHLGSDSTRGLALLNLANALYEQGLSGEDSNNFDQCIQIYSEGLPLISPTDPTRSRSLFNLAGAIRKQSAEGLDRSYVDEATRLYKEAIAICPQPDLGICLENLGNSVCEAWKSSDNLPVIRKAITRFNYWLEHHNMNTALTGISLEMYQLRGQFPLREPDRSIGNNGNIVDRHHRARFPMQPEAKYGFIIRNTSQEDFFPYLFFFDPDDYTIQCWSSPKHRNVQPPLSRGGSVTVGMGEEVAFEFEMAPGESSSSGFLKLFVSTEYLDLGWVEQRSPFNPHFEEIPMPDDPFSKVSRWGALSVILTAFSE